MTSGEDLGALPRTLLRGLLSEKPPKNPKNLNKGIGLGLMIRGLVVMGFLLFGPSWIVMDRTASVIHYPRRIKSIWTT